MYINGMEKLQRYIGLCTQMVLYFFGNVSGEQIWVGLPPLFMNYTAAAGVYWQKKFKIQNGRTNIWPGLEIVEIFIMKIIKTLCFFRICICLAIPFEKDMKYIIVLPIDAFLCHIQ